jgi:hypothetical protein
MNAGNAFIPDILNHHKCHRIAVVLIQRMFKHKMAVQQHTVKLDFSPTPHVVGLVIVRRTHLFQLG